MKNKSKITIFLGLIIAIIMSLDSTFDLGILDNLLSANDTTAPTIHIEDLPTTYLINSDALLNVTCQDDVDDTCTVEMNGTFDTSQLGEYTLTLMATDNSGNTTSIEYVYNVVDNVDGSLYIPTGYYDGIDGLTGETLKKALHDIVSGHTEYPYTSTKTDVWDILRDADEDPNNPDNIIAFYTGLSIPKDCQDTVHPPEFCQMEAYGEMKTVEWNREHIWSKSRGDFSDPSDLGAHTDTHHLVAAERVMNSTKNNRFFEDCHDGDDENIVDRGYGNYTCNTWEFEPRDEVKGDVARMIFYMAVSYDDDILDLEVVNDPDQDKDLKLPVYGDIDDLLRWNKEDPVSEKEILRNQVIYTYQGNRNPFIDMPELIEKIWGEPEDYQTNNTTISFLFVDYFIMRPNNKSSIIQSDFNDYMS
jgi:endonuclease I